MKNLLNHWYNFNLILAIVIIILIIVQKVNLTFQQRLLLFEFAFMNLHIWEEYDHPGDMPGTLNVTLYHNRKSPTIYPFNQLSAMVCNDSFAAIIWLIPVLLPQWSWLTLAAVIWGIIEFGLHLFYYPHRNRTSYFSGGIVTALLGFLPCGVIYLAFAFGAGKVTITGLIFGILYPAAWDLVIFRWLGAHVMATRRPRFPFTTHQMVQYLKAIKSHPIRHHKPGTL